MFEIGRVCVKLAGRDAGMKCIVIDVVDHSFVVVDGQTRRRKCNIKHLEPLSQVLQISKNAPAAEVVRAMKELGIEMPEKKSKARKESKKERPKSSRTKKAKPVKEAKLAKEKKPKAEKAEETSKANLAGSEK
ncbi:MAG: 50S ribosomal protein L14e [archaeon]